MKPKKFGRKLFLNKKTIVDLNNGELGYVRGGGNAPPTPTCYAVSCPSDCPCPTEFTCAVTPNQCAHP